jgi:hypothetical protein
LLLRGKTSTGDVHSSLVIVGVEPDVGIADARFRRDRHRFNGEQGSAGQRELSQMDQVQSVIEPSTAEYWHIGAMPIRFGSVSLPS